MRIVIIDHRNQKRETVYSPQYLQKEARRLCKGTGKCVDYWLTLHEPQSALQLCAIAEYRGQDGALYQQTRTMLL